MERRVFVKNLAAGAALGYFASMGLVSTVFKDQFVDVPSPGTKDIGEIKSLKIKCISETSWFNDGVLLSDIQKAGGMTVNQYEIDWSKSGVKEGFDGDNRGGYCALIEAEGLNDEKHTFLLDVGWNTAWNEKRFKEEDLVTPLENGDIEFIVISHEHFDHFWGLPTITKYNPEIPMYIPSTFYQEGYDLMDDAGFKGQLTEVKPGEINELFPGCASFTFDLPIITRVRGEQMLVFNVKDKGMVFVSGCCHPSIITVMDYIYRTYKGGENIYGIYGGLHISPFGEWNPSYDDLIMAIPDYGVERIGANHCTGLLAVERMIEFGIPIVEGTASHKTRSELYLGNGDVIEF